MSEIKISINFNVDKNSRIDYDNCSRNFNLNNVSDMERLTDKGNNTKPLLFGVSTFEDNHTFGEDYNGIISSKSMQELLDSGITPTMRVRGVNICALMFDFDENYGSYITKIWTEQTGYITNNDYDLLLPLEEMSRDIEIKILELNDNSKPIIIRRITNKIVKTYSNKNIRNLKLGSEIDNASKPSHSVIGKYGSFEIIDNDKEFAIFERNGMLDTQCDITIYYNGSIVSKMKSKNWKTSNSRLTYSVELSDETYNWNNIIVDRKIFTNKNNVAKLLYDVLSEAGIQLSNAYDMYNKLSKFNIQYSYTDDKMTLIEFLNAVCELTLTSMKVNDKGELEVFNNV